jgi:IclR family transcriptional regulator, mhp operon transcriptional activator
MMSGMATDDRLLRVLRAFNAIGPCTVLDVHRSTGISRQAIYRVVESLIRHGYVARIPGDSRVRLTSQVRALSAGYRDDDRIVEAGAAILGRLQRDVRWPTSLAMPDRDKMVVRETTRHRSPFVFDAGAVGIRLPMLRSSLGLAYVSFCAQATRQIILDLLRKSPDPLDAVARNARQAERLLRNTAQRGYAYRQGGIERKTSSISVPIMTADEALAAICVTFATSAVTQRQAVARFLPALRAAASDIAASVGEQP